MFRHVLDNKEHINVTESNCGTVVDVTVAKTVYSIVVDVTVAKTVYSAVVDTTVANNRSRNCLFDSCNCLKPNGTNGPR